MDDQTPISHIGRRCGITCATWPASPAALLNPSDWLTTLNWPGCFTIWESMLNGSRLGFEILHSRNQSLGGWYHTCRFDSKAIRCGVRRGWTSHRHPRPEWPGNPPDRCQDGVGVGTTGIFPLCRGDGSIAVAARPRRAANPQPAASPN